jgi:TonB family protein
MVHTHTTGLNHVGVAFWMLCGLSGFALAAGSGGQPQVALPTAPPASAESAGQLFDFHIPAQPLPAALDQFARVTGRSALFPSTLVTAPSSAPVNGRYTSKAALHILLEGTGLDVQEISAGHTVALVLTPTSPQPPATDAAAGARSDPDSLLGYDSIVQTRIWEAICANPDTVQGSYRTVLRFGVDPSGRISRARLLRSTGNARRDTALLEILRRVQIDQPPPPDMDQPLTMLILPGQADGPVCATASGRP